ncbi:UNVERIFIED_CONTAM: hypothetical protein Sindi_0173800 [Sesamum indicum]
MSNFSSSAVSRYGFVEIFVEVEKIYENNVADDSFVGDWGTYMSMLTEDPHNLLAVRQAMVTLRLMKIMLVHLYSTNKTMMDSKSNEVENDPEGQNDNNLEYDDEVSIPVMLDVLESNSNESSSHVEEGINLNKPASSSPLSLYLVIPFFSTPHPEVTVDSHDILSGNWGHFYDSNFGELECGMIFKGKAHLKASVQDFSMLFAI